ncbi:membrane protein FxsA [bacterium]|nr:membrane protein FxsA [bacterium]
MFFKLFLLFIIIPILEMAVLIELGQRFGTWRTIGLIVITGIVGASLAKSQGLQVYRNLQASLYNGRMPHNHLIEGLLVLIGGAFLITPGLLTDMAGLILVLPWTRRLIRERLKRYFKARITRIQTYEDII